MATNDVFYFDKDNALVFKDNDVNKTYFKNFFEYNKEPSPYDIARIMDKIAILEQQVKDKEHTIQCQAKEYTALSELTMKLDKALDHHRLVDKAIQEKIERQKAEEPGAYNAIRTIQRNGPHATMLSIIENGN